MIVCTTQHFLNFYLYLTLLKNIKQNNHFIIQTALLLFKHKVIEFNGK